MAQLESQAERADAVPDDGSPKYMPSTEDTDPIVRALKTVLKCKEVTSEKKFGFALPFSFPFALPGRYCCSHLALFFLAPF